MQPGLRLSSLDFELYQVWKLVVVQKEVHEEGLVVVVRLLEVQPWAAEVLAFVVETVEVVRKTESYQVQVQLRRGSELWVFLQAVSLLSLVVLV